MSAIERLSQGMQELGRSLDDPDARPDPARTDWGTQRALLDELKRLAEDEIAAVARDATSSLPEDQRLAVLTNAAAMVGEVAAVHQAARREAEALRILRTANSLDQEDWLRVELEAARSEPDAYVSLALARWYMRAKDFETAERILKGAKRSARSPALREAMQKMLDGARPLDGAPALFRINGFGIGLYGARDERADGSHVATTCLSALFIPVLPLSAYRVIDHHDGSYTFLAKERLSPFARGYRWLVLGGAALAIIVAGVNAWLGSDAHQAEVAFERAQAHEAAGRIDEALAGYRDVAGRPAGPAPEAGQAIMRLLIARVPAPMTSERVDEAERITRAFEALPVRARASAPLVAALARWEGEIEGDELAPSRARLRLAHLALRVEPASRTGHVAELERAIGTALEAEWPVEALHHFLVAGEDDDVEHATAIVERIGAQPSLVGEAATDLLAWEARAPAPSEARAPIVLARQRLADWAGDAARRQALEAGDTEALEAWHAAQPADQQVAIALAGAHIAAGRAAEGRAVLESYGGPGMLTSEGQRALASCIAEEGRLAEADALLTHQVGERLPAFLEAQRAYQQTSEAKVEQWLTSARLGMERELEARLVGADQATSERIVGEWLRERAANDPELAGLRHAYTASGHVVAAVLSLGGIKLRRASESSGQERAARLREAERLFLSIRDEAEGEPGYHLSLGQVYHRLGRADEGEAELRGVLDRNVPELTLSVAHAYRELGLVRRSREVATALYESLRSDSNPQDQLQASQVAFFLTRLARNLEEEEQWLERSPQDSPAVQIELTRSRGQRALGERRLREADGLFAEVVRRLEEQGTADAAIVNNAALARVQRFECTGEVAHVDAAIAGLEHAVRLAPDNSLTLSNLAEILTFRARLRVLDRELHAASLRLDASAAKDLVDAISGDEGERLRAALRQDPAWRRAQEVTRQEQALAPRRTIGYGRAWSFIEGDDLEGLRALVARARAAAPLDTSDFVAERERYERGDSSERLLSDLAAERTDGESKLAEARRARHAPTLAAALFLLARSTIDHASYTTDLAGTRRAVQLLREARETWPALAARRTHAAALLQVALFEALPGAPALAQRWRQEQRRHSLHVFLLNAARADASAGERLRARPELAEAARLRLELEPAHLGIDDVILAELTGDRELAERAGGVRSGERTRLELELREALWPLPDYAVHRTLLSD